MAVTIESASGTIPLGMGDIQEGGLNLDEKAVFGDSLSLGGAIIAQLDLTVKNTDGRFSDTQFYGGIIIPKVALLVDGAFEWVPLGVFNITDVSMPTATITLGAKNNLFLLDVSFSEVPVSYPATNLQILTAVCNYCGVLLRTTSFLNSGYVVKAAPENSMTCRDVVSDIAEMAGCFVRCTRDTGELELVWFDNPGFVSEASVDGNTDSADGGNFSWYLNKSIDGGIFAWEVEPAAIDGNTDSLDGNSAAADGGYFTDKLKTAAQLGPGNRYDMAVNNGEVQITGVMLETTGKKYLVGSDFYALDITQNSLIVDDDIEAVLQSLADRLIGFTYLPYTSNWQGNPALEPGDTVEQTGRDGIVRRTIAATSTYSFRGNCIITAPGATQGATGYQGITKKYAQLVRNVHQKQAQLTSLQQAIANASMMIAGIWGGYVVNGDTLSDPKYKGNIFICDSVGSDPSHPDVTKAAKVWRWNLGGFGYSLTGVDGPYATAITDGRIVANIIQGAMIIAGSITGDQIAGQTITGDKIQAGTITGDKIKGHSITADSIDVTNLSVYKLIALNNQNNYVTIDQGSDATMTLHSAVNSNDSLQLGVMGTNWSQAFIKTPLAEGIDILAENSGYSCDLNISNMLIVSHGGVDMLQQEGINSLPLLNVDGELWTSGAIRAGNGSTADITIGGVTLHFNKGIFTGTN